MGAAKTPNSVTSESFGSMKLVSATFGAAALDDGDTWVTNIPNALAYWVNPTDDSTTQASNAIDVVFSAGTFTFRCGENGRTGILYALTKS
jgi:hypothetical protein